MSVPCGCPLSWGGVALDGTGDVVFEVWARSGDHAHSFGARWTREQADVLLREAQARVAAVGGRNDMYWVEERPAGSFRFPSRPTPRERFWARGRPDSFDGQYLTVDVFDGSDVVTSFRRNHRALFNTFEPFRQQDRLFALVSVDYTATGVLDLATGELVAGEPSSDDGFCPVGFYVPDWWDVHDGTVLPGSSFWRPVDHEWPDGSFGFVWGCLWGDDHSWKVEVLDLSAVQSGVVVREPRFGYVELGVRPGVPVWDVISVSSFHGRRTVRLLVEQRFDLEGSRLVD